MIFRTLRWRDELKNEEPPCADGSKTCILNQLSSLSGNTRKYQLQLLSQP